MFNSNQLKEIFERTNGHCHFCGDPLILEKYGLKNLKDLDGVWEADHIIQKAKKGQKSAENCLPACYRCNHLRWHRAGSDLRELIFLGLICKDEIKKVSDFGKHILNLKAKREEANRRRRRELNFD